MTQALRKAGRPMSRRSPPVRTATAGDLRTEKLLAIAGLARSMDATGDVGEQAIAACRAVRNARTRVQEVAASALAAHVADTADLVDGIVPEEGDLS